MDNSYKAFEKLSLKYFEAYKVAYLKKISNAIESKRPVVHQKFLDYLIHTDKLKIESDLGQNFTIINELEEDFGIDSSLSKSDIFNQKISLHPKKHQKELIENLAKLDSIIKFYYQISKDSPYSLKKDESDKFSSNITGIKWKEGATKTDFIQLVYALHESGLLRNEKEHVTKLVEELAVLFHFDIGPNWQQLHTDSKTKRNNGYEIKIFSDLESSYKKYLDKKLKKIENGK